MSDTSRHGRHYSSAAHPAWRTRAALFVVSCSLWRPAEAAPELARSHRSDAAGARSDVGTAPAPPQALPGGPLAGLTTAEQRLFAAGRAAFEADEDLKSGLGPVFNESACNRCHNRAGVGGAGLQSVVLAGKLDGHGFDALIDQGGPSFALVSVSQLRSVEVRRSIPDCKLPSDGELVPAEANVIARRRTTALFGLGLVDATPDVTFTALAANQPRAIRGRAARVSNISRRTSSVGKFGWKAQMPTLFQFAGTAYLNELGITNPEYPNEQAPLGSTELLAACDLVSGLEDGGEKVQRVTDFMSLLAPIAPLEQTPASRAGGALFNRIGCAGCHTPSLTSGESPIAALAHQEYRPFSDFLLHDMGALADQIAEGDAAPREMRTAPLWGLRKNSTRLLHDGRARTVTDAITLHDGQGAVSRDAFRALSENERARLLAFLNTL
jgi:CxxC motif-containing protein (DUF1111 family)